MKEGISPEPKSPRKKKFLAGAMLTVAGGIAALTGKAVQDASEYPSQPKNETVSPTPSENNREILHTTRRRPASGALAEDAEKLNPVGEIDPSVQEAKKIASEIAFYDERLKLFEKKFLEAKEDSVERARILSAEMNECLQGRFMQDDDIPPVVRRYMDNLSRAAHLSTEEIPFAEVMSQIMRDIFNAKLSEYTDPTVVQKIIEHELGRSSTSDFLSIVDYYTEELLRSAESRLTKSQLNEVFQNTLIATLPSQHNQRTLWYLYDYGAAIQHQGTYNPLLSAAASISDSSKKDEINKLITKMLEMRMREDMHYLQGIKSCAASVKLAKDAIDSFSHASADFNPNVTKAVSLLNKMLRSADAFIVDYKFFVGNNDPALRSFREKISFIVRDIKNQEPLYPAIEWEE